MTDDIRQSLTRLGQINPADLDAVSSELTTMLAALRQETERLTHEVNTAVDSTDPACNLIARELVKLLQLTQAVVDARAKLNKLTAVACKAIGQVFKKVPKEK